MTDDEDDDAPPTRSRGRRFLSHPATRMLVLACVIVLAVAGVSAAISHVTGEVTTTLDENIERFGDPFASLPASVRPTAEPEVDAMNVLLLGSDSRVAAADPSQWTIGAQRTDAIMLVHVPADRKGAYVVSIPRDSWVDVPGHGKNKINAAYSFGGPSLMVRTVEKLTKVRIDHVAVIDFEGFVALTDELGGVTITVPERTRDQRGEFEPGVHHMDGATALRYVRQRNDVPGGDLGRVRRQQNWIRSVLKSLVSKGTLTDPKRLDRALTLVAKAIATDDDFTMGEMRTLALSLSSVSQRDVSFFTAPVSGFGRSPDGKQSIVLLNDVTADPLWRSIVTDDVEAWIERYQPQLLGDTVR